MKIGRRSFLGAMMSAGAFAYAQPRDLEDSEPSFIFSQSAKIGLSIMQGMTDETTAQFSIVAGSGNYSFEVVRQDGAENAVELTANFYTRSFSQDRVFRLNVTGLELGPVYRLRVLDEKGMVKDEREFKALDLSERSVKAAFISCQLDLLHRDDIWQRLLEQKPEIVFFMGDNVYADRTSFLNKNPADEKQLWERYVLTRNRVAFYFQKRLIPVIATWDDHDFGADNQGRRFPWKEASHEIFETFMAQDPRPALIAGPGVARKFSAFGADFFMLDGRSFRDDPGVTGAKMLGASQEKWFFESIQPRASWLLTGSLFYGGYTGGESFEAYGDDFKNFNRRLKDSGGLFCYGSGDVHFSEFMEIEAAQLGYKTFEMVSSSIHSYTFPGHENRFSNPRRRASTSSHNFVIFEGTFGEDKIDGVITAITANRADFTMAARVSR
jgi:hypothetical protein